MAVQDGKWIAYNSDESGRPEAYFWEGRRMMMATVTRDPILRVVSRQPLFEGHYLQEYDVSRDGTRLLVIESKPSGVELVVIPNWLKELKEKAR